MAKKRAKSSRQQRRQEASKRTRRRRAEVAEQAQEAQREAAVAQMSPGDRVNAIFGELGRSLDSRPIAARGVALLVDYILCGMLVMVILAPVFNRVGAEGATNVADLASAGLSGRAILGVLAASLAISFAYYVLIPLRLLPGRTPGKYLTHLEVVMLDGSPATLSALAARWAFMTLAETLFTFVSSLVIQYVTLVGGSTVGNAYTFAGALCSLLSILVAWRGGASRRALHDLVAGTWVYSSGGKRHE